MGFEEFLNRMVEALSMGKTRGRLVCHILISGEDRINRCPYYPLKDYITTTKYFAKHVNLEA